MAGQTPTQWLRNRFCRRPPIGIDFGVDRVSWAQFERWGSGFRVRDARVARIRPGTESLFDSETALGEMARDVLGSGRFRGRRVVTHAPSQELRLMVLSYEVDPGQSEAAQILGLVRERMQSDLSSHVVDYVPIRSRNGQSPELSAMVAVIPEAPVIERLESLRRAGLEVDALEIAPWAVRRLLVSGMIARGVERTDELILALSLASDRTEFTLLSGRRMLLYRQIEVGTDSLEAAVSKHLECDARAARDLLHSYGVIGQALAGEEDGAAVMVSRRDTEAVAYEPDSVAVAARDAEAEIARSLREIVKPELKPIVEQVHKAISYAAFQTHGMTVEGIQLIESAFECPGLGGLLEEMLQLPVSKVEPFAGFDRAHVLDGMVFDSRISLALGFALRGLLDE